MKINTLTVIAHLPHYIVGSEVFAYEPYVREMELWCQLASSVVIYTDIVKGKPKFPVKALPNNVQVKKIRMRSGPGFTANFLRLFQLPFVTIRLIFIIRGAKVLHLRSPGITTLLANVINKIFNRPVIVKWATQFAPMPIQNRILHWELKLLENPPSNTRVLIYGISENPQHISFIPALMAESEVKLNTEEILVKPFADPVRIICVGRLFRYKEFDQVILALTHLNQQKPHVQWVLNMIGDGEDMDKLRTMALEGGVDSKINFHGQKSFSETCNLFAQSDISIIPGRYEGWAKVINESWSFGVIPMVTSGGNTAYPIRLSGGGGIIYKEDLSDFSTEFEKLVQLPVERLKAMREKGYLANKDMSLESFKRKLALVLDDFEK